MTMPVVPAAAAVQAPATAPQAPAQSGPERTTATQRAAALREQLGDEPLEAPGAGGDDDEGSDAGGEQPSQGQQSAKDAGAGESPEEKRAKARLARIEEWREKERQKMRERESKKAVKTSASEVEKLRARISELEPMNDVFKSEDALLAAAEARGMSAEKLAAWMRQRLSDPSAIAQAKAKTVEDGLRAELAKVNERLDKMTEAQREAAEQAKAEAQGAERAKSFITEVESKASENPCTAAFLKRHGAHGLIAFANQFIVPHLPEDYSNDVLHDQMEYLLENFQVGPTKAAPDATANGTSPSSKKQTGQEKPVTTLSNALVTERHTVTEEVPLHTLSLRERAARLKADLDRE